MHKSSKTKVWNREKVFREDLFGKNENINFGEVFGLGLCHGLSASKWGDICMLVIEAS